MGFGSLGGDSDAANSGEEGRDGRSDDGDDGSNYAPPTTAPPPPPTTTTPPPPPPTTQAYVAPTTAAAAYKPAAAYVDPYADVPAVYNWEYAVKDDYSNNDFGAKENRDGYLTNGMYFVALPDGRLQTVTYTVDGGNGYVPVVEYAGEAQYPPENPSYSA